MNNYISYSVNAEEIYDESGDMTFGDDYWLIEKIYVPVEMRGQGVARKMLTEAIAKMQAEHPEYAIRLVCEAQDEDTDQEKLAAFYESVGFSAIGDEIGTMELM
ncbi:MULTISPECIES: GNAT family N-acetyltransferase [Edwardsiella]|uniref:GNAT family N-acetyltransferase n=1 Tax=Edwardsiella anguillarum TaxID=1821960 RepID=A0ABY8SI66_9GAMM|nr:MULTISPECIES: GNAT family N-acetyltransferase [Edwardsiella]WJN66868.1 hypothetical protein CFHODIGL_00053 [Edwardsiella phage EPP-1]KAB0585071.1 GNAT family N-acetyltransferase [Edwardsiella anguillarum]UJT80191.1 GNAT family N-acetyltransferase [Edwardsiella piscicida]UOU79941.1 GNAT family N-acetyltransferase [Edwardsiella anguillarum]WHP85185.1 GNAT family N-acetyltransferase [Edwardsiella anguillarum]